MKKKNIRATVDVIDQPVSTIAHTSGHTLLKRCLSLPLTSSFAQILEVSDTCQILFHRYDDALFCGY